MASTPVEEKHKAPEVEKKQAEEGKHSYADDDMVTVIRKNWGLSGIKKGHVDYIDRVAFTGGVARNVPYKQAAEWQKKRTVGIHILPNTATEADFIRVTGITPMEDHDLATILQATDAGKILSLLSPDQLEQLKTLSSKKATK